MSADENSSKKTGQETKKRRIQRACDACRRKKVRCDGLQQAGDQCTNCIEQGVECTYVEAAKRRGPPKSYVDKVENRIERLQALLMTISPEALKRIDSSPTSISSHAAGPSTSSLPSLTPASLPPKPSSSIRFIRHLGSQATTPTTSEDDEAENSLIDRIDKLRIHPNGRRFFGKSSVVTLLKAATELKKDYFGQEDERELSDNTDEGATDLLLSYPHPIPSEDTQSQSLPWLRLSGQPTTVPLKYNFPPLELISTLTDLYFTHMNLYLPLLHRPSFERAISQGLHFKDNSFASALLLVCAVAARYSDDPRVLDETEVDEKQCEDMGTQRSPPSNTHSYGWKWFKQARVVQVSRVGSPSLYDLQCYALTSQFLQASSVPQACWTVAGIGIRAAQDVGAHRKKKRATHTVEDEMWKRAFWVLVCMDRLFASSTGRPCSIHDEDFDIDMPVECDDEYWEHPNPELRWRQPTPDRTPSFVTYFNMYIRLNQILDFLLQTVYAINKSKILLGFTEQSWEEKIVSELDSALNTWLDNIPDHLRWDPTHTNERFFKQSASLYSAYYHIRILVHRPFIPSPRKPNGALSFPSLAICTNAARECSHVVDAQRKRTKVAIPPVQTAAFSSGVILLLSIWGGKQSGLLTDFDREMGDVRKCMDVLKASESRWFHAGRLYDILCELASVGDLPVARLSSDYPATNQKREREPELGDNEDETKGRDDTPVPMSASHQGSMAHPLYETRDAILMDHMPRAIAGRSNRRQEPVLVRVVSDEGGIRGGLNPPVLIHPVAAQQQQHQQQYEQGLYPPMGYGLDLRPMYHPPRRTIPQTQTQDPLEFPLQPQPLVPPPIPRLQYLQSASLHGTPRNQIPQHWGHEPIATGTGTGTTSRRDRNMSHGTRSEGVGLTDHTHIPLQARMLPLEATTRRFTPSVSSSSSHSPVYYSHQPQDPSSVSSFGVQRGEATTSTQIYMEAHHASSSFAYHTTHGGHEDVGRMSNSLASRAMRGMEGEHNHMGVAAINGTSTGATVADNDGAYPMWTTAPMNFELNEWENYLSNFDNQTP